MIDGIDIAELLANIKAHKESFLMLGVSIVGSLALAYLLSLLLEHYIQKHLEDSPWLEENRKKVRYGIILTSTLVLCISFLSTTEVFRNLSWVLAPLAIGVVYLARKAIENIFEFFLLLWEGKIMTGNHIQIRNKEFHIDTTGKIQERNTRKAFLKTYDGGEVLLRHHWIFEGIVHNYSKSQQRRVQIKASFPLSTGLKELDTALTQLLIQYPHHLPQYPTDALLLSIKDGMYHYRLQFWIDKSEIGIIKAKQELRALLLQTFSERSLPLPYMETEYHKASGHL